MAEKDEIANKKPEKTDIADFRYILRDGISKHEIKDLKKYLKKFELLENWFLNSNLVILAFFITILVQIKLNDGIIPFQRDVKNAVFGMCIAIIASYYKKIIEGVELGITSTGIVVKMCNRITSLVLKIKDELGIDCEISNEFEIIEFDYKKSIKKLKKWSQYEKADFFIIWGTLMGIFFIVVFFLRFLFS